MSLLRIRPLRIKLTLWYLLVFFLLQAGLTFAVVLWRRDSIVSWRQERNANAADVMVENVLVAEPETWTSEELKSLVPEDSGFVACAVRDASGALLGSFGFEDPEAIPFGAEELMPSGGFRAVFRELPAGAASLEGPLRLVTLPFRYDDRFHYLQAALPTPFTLGPFTDQVWISGPVGLIAALVASWLIAGRAVAPMEQLSEAAKGVSPANLGERIRVETSDNEVSRLQGELNSALGRLEEGYRAQERFISNVSHELKTPLAVLLTDSQVIQLGDESLDAYRSYARRVEEEMKRLAKLVESFLTLARSDMAQGPALIQPISINDVVIDSVQHCGSFARGAGIHLVPRLAAPDDGFEPLVAGDPELLRTMLDNVVRNAIRHSPTDGAVDIDVSCDEKFVNVVIHDRGPGIPEDYIERVFESLVRVPGVANGEGQGLGLAITRNIAQLHDGKVRATNPVGGGCTFEFNLPRAWDEEDEEESQGEGSNASTMPADSTASPA